MPPVTPSSSLPRATAAPLSSPDDSPPLPSPIAAPALAPVPVLDLAVRDLFKGDRQVVLGARVHHGRRELLERALAEVVVVGVDLAGALGGHDDARVRRVDVLQQAIYAG